MTFANISTKMLALVLAATTAGAAWANESQGNAPSDPSAKQVEATESKKAENERKLAEKQGEAAKLRDEAKRITEQIGKLASTGSLPTNAEALELMRQMVEDLEEINKRLEALENEVNDLRGWVEGQNESGPILAGEVAEARRFRPSFYAQFQYRNSDRQALTSGNIPGTSPAVPFQSSRTSFFGVPFTGARESAFFMRRVRVGGVYTVDPRTSVRFSFDTATGANQLGAELRDAALIYVIQPSDTTVGTELTAGQFAVPLGFELERSSADRELPERAQYNRIMFNGDRIRGVMLRHALGNGFTATVGASSSLTYADAEQSTRASMPNGRGAGFGALRFETPSISAGISHFQGKRPAWRTAGATGTATVSGTTVVTPANPVSAPEIYRRFTYVDASIIGFLVPQLTIRAEGMRGRDRLPIANTQNSSGAADAARVVGNDMNGWQLQGTFNLTSRTQLTGRIESFDPDEDQVNDAVSGFGVGFRYFINPGASLNVTVERFRVPQWNERRTHTVTTFRYQFRF